jgi:L-threonylcarbamoyladenylate synthase
MHTIVGQNIEKAVELLTNGSVVAIPTETVYGLAANALDETAVLEIYNVKERPSFNPLILHVGHHSQIEKYVTYWPKVAEGLMERFMPGPLTVLLPKSAKVPDLVTAGSRKVAIRMPQHPITSVLLQQIDFPLAAPSANPSGFLSPTTAQHVLQGLDGKIPYILDGGACQIGLESTIIGFNEYDEVVVHRLGGLGVDVLEKHIGKKPIIDIQHSQPNTPGQLKSHYATQTPLIIGDLEALAAQYAGKNVAYISFDRFLSQVPHQWQFQLSANGNLSEAAKNLFPILHQADQLKASAIVVALVPNNGIGLAINDRLQRAQHALKPNL